MDSAHRDSSPSLAEHEKLHVSEAQREALELAKAHGQAIGYIERHLFDPMTVKSIADFAGYSPSRFSRGFTRLQGESVMAYVRGRRLEGAMRRLLTEPGLRIVDLAFDCGFDSQEAFTRAFARAFGKTPGQVKNSCERRPLVRRRRSSGTQQLELHERVEELPPTHLAGLAAHFTPANLIELPGLWGQIIKLKGFPGRIGRDKYAVKRKRYCEDGSFDYFAGLKIEPDCTPPEPMEVLCLAPRSYVVYRLMLREGCVFPQLVAATELILAERLPESGHVLVDEPDFEVFPRNFHLEGGWVDHYLPIAS